MDFKAFTDGVVLFVQEHRNLAPLICGLLAFGESLAVISLIIPASTILIALGFVIASANLDFWPIMIVTAIGVVLGDMVSYWIARHYNYAVFRVWPLSRSPKMITRGEAFIQKYGLWAVFVGRFFGPFRAMVPLFAGIFHMPIMRFMLATTASAILWAFGVLAPGAGLIWFLGN